ncbi:adenylate kinase family enzyme [Stella humosa]|uniref:Adenylate kinase family enzyme n=1 Tax=Stella humosa TaxID=94 RepID=A0A3N1KV95_9PROT|nr:AAA family ATPase [Stella humosa]ROP83167.1 adenylate kinase family enzyme [Stella humosa]BBK30056.1 ATPase AAA [Stella humosa]
MDVPPQRIVILGRSGSGKSTLARMLGARLDLPVVHLDALFWQPGWVEPDRESFRQRLTAALAGDRWITDGNFSNTFDLRLPRADLIVWVEVPRLVSICRALRRVWKYYGRTRPDLAPGCPERLDLAFLRYIWNFDRDMKPKILAAVAQHGPGVPMVTLHDDAEAAAFLATMPDRGGARS